MEGRNFLWKGKEKTYFYSRRAPGYADLLLVRHDYSRSHKDLSSRAKRGICIFSLQRFSFLIDCFPCDTGIFDLGVPIRKAAPLFFFILRRGNALSGFVEKFLQTIGHNSPLGHMHPTTGGAEENPVSLASGTRVLPAHSILAQVELWTREQEGRVSGVPPFERRERWGTCKAPTGTGAVESRLSKGAIDGTRQAPKKSKRVAQEWRRGSLTMSDRATKLHR